MRFLSPVFFLLLPTIPLLLLLHFRHTSKISQRIPNLYLWQGFKTRRLSLRRVPLNISLILQILASLSLILALARPVIWIEASPPLALIFDISASMQVREGDLTRFDLARAKALELLETGPRPKQILLLTAGRKAELVGDFSSGETGWLDAIEELAPTDQVSDLDQAVSLALELSPLGTKICVFSDGAGDSRLSPVRRSENIQLVPVGASRNNIGIVRLAPRPIPASSHDFEILCETANFSERAHQLNLILRAQDQVIERKRIQLEPGRSLTSVFAAALQEGDVLVAEIDVEDDLEVDNLAYAVLRPVNLQVLLVGPGNRYLEEALRLNHWVSWEKQQSLELSENSKYDVFILDRMPFPGFDLGNLIVIAPPMAGSARNSDHTSRGVRLDHPLLAGVDPNELQSANALPLPLPVGAEVVVSTSEGEPLLATYEGDQTRSVLLGFDVRNTGFPFSPSFPIWLSNSLSWLASDQMESGSIPAGGLFVFAGQDVVLQIVDPAGVSHKAEKVGNKSIFGHTGRTGIYSVSGPGVSAQFAVNLLDSSESDIRPLGLSPPGEVATAEGVLSAELTLSKHFAVAVFALLVVEWLVHRRFWILRPNRRGRS